MLYKVPQKIDLEDKVIGPLTFRQFLYLLAGILPAFIIGEILQSTTGLNVITGMLLCFPLWLPAIFLAFGKFQEQNLDQVLIAMLNFMRIPKSLIWDKRSMTPKVLIKTPKKVRISYSRPKTLESRLQDLSESMSIYGVKPETNAEENRVIAQRAKNLVIKTKIKSVHAVPNEERHFVADKDLEKMQKDFGLKEEQSTKSKAVESFGATQDKPFDSTQDKQLKEKNDIMGIKER